MKNYHSSFSPSPFIYEHILRKGRIVATNESPSSMVERVVLALYNTERQYSSAQDARRFATSLGSLMDEGKIVFSTPIMTNAGRKDFVRPLSACTVPPVNLRGDLQQVREMVNTYHEEGMGTGFDLNEVDDPVATLLYLNEVAVEGASRGNEDRPVGNMGICDIDHPRIVDFIVAKHIRRNTLWKFNVSVNTSESFWLAVEEDSVWMLRNGMQVFARELLDLIVESAHACADPGIVFMDRINRDNPVPGTGSYRSIAPCAEVGLLPGETCQFGYINIGAFQRNNEVDLDGLGNAVDLMVRALDNCLTISTQAYRVELSKTVVRHRRKIGVGICGLADLLIDLRIPYNSPKARELARNVVAFINYRSKIASHNLAKERGSFEAMRMPFGCRYNEMPGFLEQKYGYIGAALTPRLCRGAPCRKV